MGNFGVVPLFCSLRLRALPLRALRILRAIRVLPVLDAMCRSPSFEYLGLANLRPNCQRESHAKFWHMGC